MHARLLHWTPLTLAICLVAESVHAAPVELQTVEIVAEGMCCQGCARKVAGKLYTARGVRSVDTDVPTHVVTVQAPKAHTAYLGTLWDAVATADGSPRSLTTAQATYRLAPADTATQRDTTAVRLGGDASPAGIRRVADRFYAIDGVTEVRFDKNAAMFLVTTAPDRRLNPWAAAEIVASAGEQPVKIEGPKGVLTIEWAPVDQLRPRDTHQTYNGGTIR